MAVVEAQDKMLIDRIAEAEQKIERILRSSRAGSGRSRVLIFIVVKINGSRRAEPRSKIIRQDQAGSKRLADRCVCLIGRFVAIACRPVQRVVAPNVLKRTFEVWRGRIAIVLQRAQ